MVGNGWLQQVLVRIQIGVDLGAGFVNFSVCSSGFDSNSLFDADGVLSSSLSFGMAPLVTLDASKIQIANDNTGNGTSKESAYKISLADVMMVQE